MLFGPSEKAQYRALSLGGGVQSTALLLMADEGKIYPRPDVAIFSDTGWEPDYVYSNVKRLQEHCSIPIVVVDGGNIRDRSIETASLNSSDSFVSLPLFTEHNGGSMMARQCTQNYKILPVRRHIRGVHNKRHGKKRPDEGWACIWIGISYDEVQRMKDAREKWIDHRWPLVEKQMNRADCLDYLNAIGWGEVKKSSCIGCPFHDDKAWAWMKENRPDDFEDACQFDEKIRRVEKMGAVAYLHKSRTPLREVDFGPAGDDGQLYFGDCGGFCHV